MPTMAVRGSKRTGNDRYRRQRRALLKRLGRSRAAGRPVPTLTLADRLALEWHAGWTSAMAKRDTDLQARLAMRAASQAPRPAAAPHSGSTAPAPCTALADVRAALATAWRRAAGWLRRAATRGDTPHP